MVSNAITTDCLRDLFIRLLHFRVCERTSLNRTAIWIFTVYDAIAPGGTSGITAVLMFSIVTLSLAGSLICLGCNLGYFCTLQPYGNAALNFQYLFLIALFLRILLLKRRFNVRWGRSISLLLLAPLLFFLVEVVLRIIDHNHGSRTVVSQFWPEIIGIVSAVLWWIALRNGPNITLSAQRGLGASVG
jgi:hypothetical protein